MGRNEIKTHTTRRLTIIRTERQETGAHSVLLFLTSSSGSTTQNQPPAARWSRSHHTRSKHTRACTTRRRSKTAPYSSTMRSAHTASIPTLSFHRTNNQNRSTLPLPPSPFDDVHASPITRARLCDPARARDDFLPPPTDLCSITSLTTTRPPDEPHRKTFHTDHHLLLLGSPCWRAHSTASSSSRQKLRS
jgi:hypothetical protein